MFVVSQVLTAAAVGTHRDMGCDVAMGGCRCTGTIPCDRPAGRMCRIPSGSDMDVLEELTAPSPGKEGKPIRDEPTCPPPPLLSAGRPRSYVPELPDVFPPT